METQIIAELKATKERVIAINLHDSDARGAKGTILNFDELNVEFLTDNGKLLVMPRSAYTFRRIEKEDRQ